MINLRVGIFFIRPRTGARIRGSDISRSATRELAPPTGGGEAQVGEGTLRGLFNETRGIAQALASRRYPSNQSFSHAAPCRIHYALAFITRPRRGAENNAPAER